MSSVDFSRPCVIMSSMNDLVTLGKTLHGTRANLIIEIVSAEFGISSETLKSARRSRPVVRARHAAMWFIGRSPFGIKQQFPSLSQIGRLIGVDHTTVIYGLSRVQHLFGTDQEFTARIIRIQRALEVIDASAAVKAYDLRRFGIKHDFKAIKNPTIAEVRLSVQVRHMGAIPKNRQMPIYNRVGGGKGVV